MFDKWLKLPAHYYLRITALTILMVGIAVSNVLMSIGAIWIISNWLIEADFKRYKENIKKSPVFWLFSGLLIFSFLSLLWTDDIAYGIKDLMVKLPFFVIPLVMSISKPIKEEVFYYLIYVFLAVLLLTSIFNYYWYNVICEEANDIRKMSYFMSHVRYSIILDLGVFSAFYLILKRKLNVFLLIGIILWLLFYIFKAQILNGYVLLLALILYSVYFFINKIANGILKKVTLLGFFILLGGGLVIIKNELNEGVELESYDYSNLDERTANGNKYYHDTISPGFENGHPIWIYICQDELRKEWNERSVIDYDSLDRKNQPMFGTLMRFMTSKNIRKDSVGLWSLTEEELKKIENGHTSIVMNSSGMREKINQFKIDYALYQNGGDPNGHSLMQRAEHFKAALSIIKDNWIMGVGIGDVNAAFELKYDSMNSKLTEENRHRSHNQFLTYWISHGLVGVFLLIAIILFPIVGSKKPDYFTSIVGIALFVSCFFQDMIETQAGATVFGLFYVLSVFREKED